MNMRRQRMRCVIMSALKFSGPWAVSAFTRISRSDLRKLAPPCGARGAASVGPGLVSIALIAASGSDGRNSLYTISCGREGGQIQGISLTLAAELIKLYRRQQYFYGREALRTAHCSWYKRVMGIHGPRDRTIQSIFTARGRVDRVLGLMVLGLMPVL